MKLHYDPFQIFKSSKTPAGLYARQKWLGEQHLKNWQSDFNSTKVRLLAGQSPDGSWSQSVIQTIDHLFGLHLTIRQPSSEIDKALDWLVAQTEQMRIPPKIQKKQPQTVSEFTHLPFVAGRRNGLGLGATLFLASIFDRPHDPQILNLYQMLNEDAVANQIYWKDMACFSNILRAFVVHPKYAFERATQMAVDRLEALQAPKGDWGEQVPFYLTINALAHLSLPRVDDQLAGAFQRLIETQQPNGTWGKDQPEWNTFLIIHAFKNKTIL